MIVDIVNRTSMITHELDKKGIPLDIIIKILHYYFGDAIKQFDILYALISKHKK